MLEPRAKEIRERNLRDLPDDDDDNPQQEMSAKATKNAEIVDPSLPKQNSKNEGAVKGDDSASATVENEFESLVVRQEQVKQRLEAIALPPQPGPAPRATKIHTKVASIGADSGGGDEKPNNKGNGGGSSSSSSVLVPHQVPLLIKTDTHWDFVLKEMQWYVWIVRFCWV